MSINHEALREFRDAIQPALVRVCTIHGKNEESQHALISNMVVCSMMSSLGLFTPRPAMPVSLPQPLRIILRHKRPIRPVSIGEGWVGIESQELAPSQLFFFCKTGRYKWAAGKSDPSPDMLEARRPADSELIPLGERPLTWNVPRVLRNLDGMIRWVHPNGVEPLLSRFREGSDVWFTGFALSGVVAFLKGEKLSWRLKDLGEGRHRLDLWGDSAGVVFNFVPGLEVPEREVKPREFVIPDMDPEEFQRRLREGFGRSFGRKRRASTKSSEEE